VLTTIVSQDPMYVTFPVSVREALGLRERYIPRGGFKAVVIRVRLPDGRLYGQVGQLNFVNNTIAQSTDTITLRGTIPNPPLKDQSSAQDAVRELTDNEFVTVSLEGIEPVEFLAIPRAAVLSDQQGDYVFVVGADNKAEQRRVALGQSTPTIAAVTKGISEGDKVIVEGLQRVKPGQPVAPGPASALVQSVMKGSTDDAAPKSGGGLGPKPAGTAP
jgi:membrane fusion protein (multidrug efflux system)